VINGIVSWREFVPRRGQASVIEGILRAETRLQSTRIGLGLREIKELANPAGINTPYPAIVN